MPTLIKRSQHSGQAGNLGVCMKYVFTLVIFTFTCQSYAFSDAFHLFERATLCPYVKEEISHKNFSALLENATGINIKRSAAYDMFRMKNYRTLYINSDGAGDSNTKELSIRRYRDKRGHIYVTSTIVGSDGGEKTGYWFNSKCDLIAHQTHEYLIDENTWRHRGETFNHHKLSKEPRNSKDAYNYIDDLLREELSYVDRNIAESMLTMASFEIAGDLLGFYAPIGAFGTGALGLTWMIVKKFKKRIVIPFALLGISTIGAYLGQDEAYIEAYLHDHNLMRILTEEAGWLVLKEKYNEMMKEEKTNNHYTAL